MTKLTDQEIRKVLIEDLETAYENIEESYDDETAMRQGQPHAWWRELYTIRRAIKYLKGKKRGEK